jgi:hypothetical protein
MGLAPSPIAAPSSELPILQTADGGYAVLETRSGHVGASLPSGILALGLSIGGDIAEAYLVTAAASGGPLSRVSTLCFRAASTLTR